MPRISDYGGHAHSKRMGQQTTLSKTKIISMRCRDCDKLRYVLPRELHRAAVPRCLDCGGPLEKTRTQAARDKMPEITASELAGPRTPRCRCCGKQVRIREDGNIASGLTLHLKGNPKCLDYYVDEDILINVYDDRLIVAGTLDIICIFGRWKLMGLCPNGEVDHFGDWGYHAQALEFGRSVLAIHVAKYGFDGRIAPDEDSVWA